MYVDILILAQLSTGSRYGYEIKKNVERILGSSFTINSNMLYPALKRFEEMGAVQKRIETQEGKPNRHVYSMTDLGLEVLQEMLREFTPEMATSDVEFQVRVALFGLVDEKTRRDVLATRRAVLEKGLKHLQEGIEREMLDESMIYGKRVVELLKARVIQELDWIAAVEEESESC